jgi:hypothetical protein
LVDAIDGSRAPMSTLFGCALLYVSPDNEAQVTVKALENLSRRTGSTTVLVGDAMPAAWTTNPLYVWNGERPARVQMLLDLVHRRRDSVNPRGRCECIRGVGAPHDTPGIPRRAALRLHPPRPRSLDAISTSVH